MKKIKVSGEQLASICPLLVRIFCPTIQTDFYTDLFWFVLVEQCTNVVLYSSDTYSKAVCSEEFG